MKVSTRCSSCFNTVDFVPSSVKASTKERGETFSLEFAVMKCPACLTPVISKKLDMQIKESLSEEIVNTLGVNGGLLRRSRQTLGLTENQATKILDLGEEKYYLLEGTLERLEESIENKYRETIMKYKRIGGHVFFVNENKIHVLDIDDGTISVTNNIESLQEMFCDIYEKSPTDFEWLLYGTDGYVARYEDGYFTQVDLDNSSLHGPFMKVIEQRG